MDSRLEHSIASRLLDQYALGDTALFALCSQDPQLAAEMAKLEPEPALRRMLKNVPFVGPFARSIYQRLTRGSGSEQ